MHLFPESSPSLPDRTDGRRAHLAAGAHSACEPSARAHSASEARALQISIVLVNFRQPDVTAELLDQLRACTYPNLQVVLVDDGSLRDERARWHYHYPGIAVVRSEDHLGFAGATNLGIRHASGALIMVLQNNALVEARFVEPMVDVLRRYPGVGIVSPKVVFAEPAGVIDYAGAFIAPAAFGRGTQIGHGEPDRGQYDDTRLTDLPHAACLLVKREVFERVGLLPEFYFMYFEALDFAVAARRAGFATMYCGAASVRLRRSSAAAAGSPRKTYYLHRNRLVFHRRVLSGVSYQVFLLYYLLVALPLSAFQFLRKRRTDHVRALGEALDWNVRRAVDHERHEPLALPHLDRREV